MESLGSFLLKHPTFKDRVFISNPPGAAFILWSNRDFLPNISGISIVEQLDTTCNAGISGSDLSTLLAAQLYRTIPLLYIKYHKDLEYMLIDGAKMPLEACATRISEAFSVKLGKAQAKKPNDSKQIADPFHTWSRETFDGNLVYKTDVDIVTIDESVRKIKSIIEVKRSAKVKVGKWKPYVDSKAENNDTTNYLMSMSLCSILKANFFTIHHDKMNNEDLIGSDLVDIFRYRPTINQEALTSFAHENNRQTKSIDSLFK